MSQKEKEAVEEVKILIKSIGGIDSEYLKECEPENYKLCMSLSTVLNLIEEQQKEIESSVSKDRIREEIENIFTVLYEQHELDYEDIQNVIKDIHIKLKNRLLEE